MSGVEERTPAITRETTASVAKVWSVIDDGWLFPLWVVGASRMRDVDSGWPAIGTRLHHSVGGWPVLLDDKTEVLDVTPGRLIRLRAHAWPWGAAEVLLVTDATTKGTLLSLYEDASDGPGKLVPRVARQLAIAPRNRETLKRLAYLAEGR